MSLPTSKPHLKYIDCLRGYAILLVITTHLTDAIKQLPYPVARVTLMGWYGVQLFFLMSAFTLLSSWNAELHRIGSVNVINFFIRRYLRIAPAYYLAAALYFFLTPPQSGFDLGQLLAYLTFINGWHPNVMPTVPAKWTVVPGGWSIGVEFAFYALFPILASLVTNLRRAIIGEFLMIATALACNLMALNYFAGEIGPVPLSNFLYFWLPNQLPVFLLGFLLYYAIGDSSARSIRILQRATKVRYAIVGIAVVGYFSASFLRLGHFIGNGMKFPETLYIVLPLMAFVVAVASGPTLFVNRAVQEMGKVSFSAYLLHFAVLQFLPHYPGIFGTSATGIPAVMHFAVDWVFVVAATFLLAAIQYRLVELPGNNLARKITTLRTTRQLAARPVQNG
jgi:peptidoglycan/LPS O-acetylase OafA/YrhL